MILSISYELRKPGKDYEDLYNVIRSARCYCHPLTSHWLIRTELSVQTWFDKLRRVMDSNDFLFIVDITDQAYYGYLAQSVWDWMNANASKAVNY